MDAEGSGSITWVVGWRGASSFVFVFLFPRFLICSLGISEVIPMYAELVDGDKNFCR